MTKRVLASCCFLLVDLVINLIPTKSEIFTYILFNHVSYWKFNITEITATFLLFFFEFIYHNKLKLQENGISTKFYTN